MGVWDTQVTDQSIKTGRVLRITGIWLNLSSSVRIPLADGNGVSQGGVREVVRVVNEQDAGSVIGSRPGTSGTGLGTGRITRR